MECDLKIIKELKNIVGEENVLQSQEAKEPYSHDETLGLKFMPSVVVKPKDAKEISEIFKLAQKNKISVTPRGAGTGLSGGALAVLGGIVLSLERLNKIIEIDEENLMVVTQPAVITEKLQKAVEEKGLFYPPDPASLETCFIGGNIAENAGGPRAFKYGVTRNYLCGLSVVWPNGEISRLGGKLIKNVAGYDLMGLICASEGTLAVITEIVLKLIPKPAVQADLLVPFNSIEDAVKACTKIIQAKIVPATMEFMDKKAVNASEKLLEKKSPFSHAQAHLLMQLDGPSREQIQKDYEKIGEIVMQFGAEDILVAEDKTSSDRLWEMRRAVTDALNLDGLVLAREDTVVPRAKLSEFYYKVSKLENKYGIILVLFGHIGDGNVHVNMLKQNKTDETWQKNMPFLMKELFEIAISLGGSITGEHGIGYIKRHDLHMVLDEHAIKIMKGIKDLIDPQNILNPSKIFP